MVTHAEDRVKLTAEGVVSLFKVDLREGGTLRLKADNSVSWQGNTWEGTAIQMAGFKRTADEEMSRPTLTIANPNGILTAYILGNQLEKSIVTRYRILYANLIANLNIYEQDSWYISRVVGVTKISAVVELRNPIDGPNFLTPARMFIPPDFPAVSLF